MALVRSLATVGGYTGISRVLGFVRDILIASALGTGPVADAFFVAFRLPNLFRRLFAEGAFNAAFVPLFARRLEEGGQAAARAFAEHSLAVLLTSVLALSALAMAFMPWLMVVMAPGFLADPEKFELTVQLSRIAFPYLLFMALAALFGGLLNSLYKFAAAAAAPILLNVIFIGALLFVLPAIGMPGHVLAWSVAAAGAGQFLLLAIAAQRAGMALRLPRPRLTPGVKRLLKLMGPGIASAGAMQINLMVGTIIASLQAGAVSYLYYADRVYQLPLGLIGVAFGIVLLPELARKLRAGAGDEAMASLNRGLEIALLLTLPAAIALLVIPWPIVTVLFERGAFGPEASQATAWALAAYACGLPAFVLVKLLQPAFYAREDTVTPLKMALIGVGANIVLSLALFWLLSRWGLGHVGLAAATALSAWIMVILLAGALRGRGFLRFDARLRRRLPRIAAASLVMGLVLWAVQGALLPWFGHAVPVRIAGLIILIGAGLAAYGALALALGAVERSDLAGLFKRKP